MKLWTEVILEWLNCLDVSETNIRDLKELDDGNFYKKLIRLFSWKDTKDTSETENIIVKFFQDEYPEYKFEYKDLAEIEHVYITSLLLLHVSQEPLFYQPMCIRLQHETQLKIKTFLEIIIPFGRNVNKQIIKEIITEIECDVQKTPITPKTKTLKHFLNSPVARSAQSYKLLNERSRELRTLKTELEVERFEKADLQEDLRIQQNRVQNLQLKLQEKNTEIKALREEKMKPSTPQSCKKDKELGEYERYYKKEIDHLEDQLMQRQCEIDRLEVDNDTLTKKLTCVRKQYNYFEEKLEHCEKTLEHTQMQGEIKDRELINLRINNEELRTHLKEFSKTAVEELSFEIDGIAPLSSSSSSFNNSEVLSTVVDIQLQEAKEESIMLRTQLEASNKELRSLSQEYKNTTQLLKEKVQILQNREVKLNDTLNKLSDKVETIEKEKESLMNKNKNLEVLCSAQKEFLSQTTEAKNTLSSEMISLKEIIQELQEALHNKNVKNGQLTTELAEVKIQTDENLKCIKDITDQNNVYKCSVDLHNTALKQIVLHYSESNYIHNFDNKTTIELIEDVQQILYNIDKRYSSKEIELESLKNLMEQTTLKLESCQSQISQLKEREDVNILEISKLKETIVQDTIKLKQISEEVSYLQQIELKKQDLEKDVHLYKEELSTKNYLLEGSAKCIRRLKQSMQTLVKDYYTVKKDILNQINEYQKHDKATNENVLNAHKILFANYIDEQHCRKGLENELADNNKKLNDISNLNKTLENDLIKNNKMINTLKTKLINATMKITESTQMLEKLEEIKVKYENVKFEYEKVVFDLNNANDKYKDAQQEVCNMIKELKFKDEKIENLIAKITSVKLEKDLIHLQMSEESKTKNVIAELETKLIEKQRKLDQLNIEIKLKQETLELLEDKAENFTKESIISEIKLKEVITNLQEVRTNQDAVLKTQEKALSEKCIQLEHLEKEFNKSKGVLYKQFKIEKLIQQNLESKNAELQSQLDKQIKMIEELQETLREEKKELNKSKEYCKDEDAKKLEIAQICEKLECSINDLKLAIEETCTTNRDFHHDITCNVQCINNDDGIANILKIVRISINEIHATRKLILHLSSVNANLNETVQTQKIIVGNYVTKCEEMKLLKIKLQEQKNLEKKHVEHVNILIKHKESLKDCLQHIIMSRENLDTSLHELQQKWNELLLKYHSIFMMDISTCNELKHIHITKTQIENTLVTHCTHHFQNIKPLQNILWQKFVWSEQILQDTCSGKTKEGQLLDTFSDLFCDEKTIIETELDKNTILQRDIAKLQNDIDDFSNVVTSFEINIKSNEIQLQSESGEKLQLQIDELTEEKNNLHSKLNCVRITNAKLEGEIGELKIKAQEMKTSSLKEVEDFKKELIQLKEANLKLQEERDVLNKRPKKEDVDNQLKDIQDKYKVKIDEIKLNMKTAYNEQITKLSREQEQCIQERLESLQRKMELQCRKQADELNKYKTHVAGMSSQIWNVGEKLLRESQEKEKLQKELDEWKVKFQNLDQKISSIEHKASKYGNRDLLRENKEVLHKIAVIQEKTTYEKKCSIRSIQTMGNAFNVEDEEGEVFDNIYLADMKDGNASTTDVARLSILKKRNALCKPHLKSSYPAEMQFHPVPFTEDEIKAGSTADDIFNDSLSQSLLPEQKAKKRDRTQTSYKKPGPPTPSKNGGRLSLQGNEARSPSLRILRERNKDRASATPRTLKSLFISKRQGENVAVTPRGRRRSSIFCKHRCTNDR